MSVTLLFESTPKARKDHTCGLCVSTIPVGTVYYQQRCAEDGPPYSWRAHTECWGLLNAYWWECCGLRPHEVDGDAVDVDAFREFVAARAAAGASKEDQ